MRSDMQKVLTERPRRKGRYRDDSYVSRDPEDWGPGKESMSWHRYGRDKDFSDHLGPVRRFLESNIGRPWNKIWSEVCEHAKLNSVQGRHLRQHVWDYVEHNVVEIRNKVPYATSRHNGLIEVNGFWEHPKTGILHKNRDYVSPWKKVPKPENPDLKIIDDIYYGRIDGVWYELEMTIIEMSRFLGGRDKFLNIAISPLDSSIRYCSNVDKLQTTYGKRIFCSNKRQLNKKEKKKLGIK